jgi:hypothetical protein
MKMKTFFNMFGFTLSGVVVSLIVVPLVPLSLMAGEVRTKEQPHEDGGYYGNSYHLKGKGSNKGFVKREHHWQNPFSGFTKTGGKPQKQGEMPHSP